MAEPNGWNEWGKHVLKELERLNDGFESIHDKIKCDAHKEQMRGMNTRITWLYVIVGGTLITILGKLLIGVALAS